jgi:dihydropteroate synthase
MSINTGVKNKNLRLPRQRELDRSKPLVMGIINVTPDSFSDGGMFLAPDDAIRRAKNIIDEGADIIDVGGESSRPGSESVPKEMELKRVIPIIETIRKYSDLPISIDTTKADVARAALDSGADIINDISALRFDDKMKNVVVEHDVPIILMHMLGEPRTMQKEPVYKDCIQEIIDFFRERIEFCQSNGIDINQIILDPGIGFGKRLEDNLVILNELDKFGIFGRPIMIGASRKSFIQMICGDSNRPERRIGGSLAAMFRALDNGSDIVRVHDVAETVEALKVYRAIGERGVI